ncbi:COG4280 domain-containing protein [Paenibacillus pectinilyticus]|uniref:COG4280 domain-containing protein n=1 Tax=Paenibacillus pectinilyticus TaxID=512399 RepID=UPI00114CC502|nr:hypothetical protein [Paenibacillus pectinilyticus]
MEFVEALTVILAVGLVRGWKYAILGAVTAFIILILLVCLIGAPLALIIQINWVQTIVGLCSLLFGIRWLRKAILPYGGLIALHDEEEAFKEEFNRMHKVGFVKQGFDRFAFMTTFGITMHEGLETIIIVITFGLSLHKMNYTVLGAALALIFVISAGFILRKPLSKVPENTMKYVVGVMLTSFGAFWTGEGFGVIWPNEDASILYIALTIVVFSYVMVKRIKNKLQSVGLKKTNRGGVEI